MSNLIHCRYYMDNVVCVYYWFFLDAPGNICYQDRLNPKLVRKGHQKTFEKLNIEQLESFILNMPRLPWLTKDAFEKLGKYNGHVTRVAIGLFSASQSSKAERSTYQHVRPSTVAWLSPWPYSEFARVSPLVLKHHCWLSKRIGVEGLWFDRGPCETVVVAQSKVNLQPLSYSPRSINIAGCTERTEGLEVGSQHRYSYNSKNKTEIA